MLFLRDYRVPSARQRAHRAAALAPVQYFGAMIVTMALCGLWHGASWTFVLWGTLHGCGAGGCHAVAPLRLADAGLLGWALTVSFVLSTGVIFRAGSLEAAWRVYRGASPSCRSSDRIGARTPIIIAALLRLPAAGEPGHRGAGSTSGRSP